MMPCRLSRILPIIGTTRRVKKLRSTGGGDRLRAAPSGATIKRAVQIPHAIARDLTRPTAGIVEARVMALTIREMGRRGPTWRDLATAEIKKPRHEQ